MRREEQRYPTCESAELQEWKPSTDPSPNDSQRALVIASEADGGVHHVDVSIYIGPDTRRGRLMQIANNIHAVDGADVLWNDVCRRFLMQGK
jgi:hypothetical protein